MTFDNESIPDGEFDFTGKNLDMKNYYIMHKNEPFTDVAGDGLFKCKIDALDDYYKNIDKSDASIVSNDKYIYIVYVSDDLRAKHLFPTQEELIDAFYTYFE